MGWDLRKNGERKFWWGRLRQAAGGLKGGKEILIRDSDYLYLMEGKDSKVKKRGKGKSRRGKRSKGEKARGFAAGEKGEGKHRRTSIVV